MEVIPKLHHTLGQEVTPASKSDLSDALLRHDAYLPDGVPHRPEESRDSPNYVNIMKNIQLSFTCTA